MFVLSKVMSIEPIPGGKLINWKIYQDFSLQHLEVIRFDTFIEKSLIFIEIADVRAASSHGDLKITPS